MNFSPKSKWIFGCAFLWAILCVWGCNEGTDLTSPTAATQAISPIISGLTVSGNTISKATGGILKLSCQWSSGYAIGSASAFLLFVQGLNDPSNGPSGIMGPASGTSSGTARIGGLNPKILLQAQTASTTASATATTTSTVTATATSTVTATATATSTATSTVTATSSQTSTITATSTFTATATATLTTTATATFTATSTSTVTSTSSATSTITGTSTGSTNGLFGGTIANPMVIPTGIATSNKSGSWNVEIPFPSSILQAVPVGKQQMMLWMVFNNLKTNTLSFEIEFTQ